MAKTPDFSQFASLGIPQRNKGAYVPVVIKNEQGRNEDAATLELEEKEDGIRVEVLVTEGPAKGKRFVLDKPSYFLFGRQTDAHLSIPNDQYISRQHFALQVSEAECRLRDLNSTNGVLVNGVRYGGRLPRPEDVRQAPINEVRLQDGDRISVGTTHIQVKITPLFRRESAPPQKTHSARDVALLVLDLVQSTQHLLKIGDQEFSTLIGKFRARFQEHHSSSELLSLKGTGDGFLGVYRSPSAAFALASEFLQVPVSSDVQVRMALHWGTVTSIPDGTFIGQNVQRMYHLEGLQVSDHISSMKETKFLPASDEEDTKLFPATNRVLITRPALKLLNESERRKCREVGLFRLKELDESCRLWVHAA